MTTDTANIMNVSGMMNTTDSMDMENNMTKMMMSSTTKMTTTPDMLDEVTTGMPENAPLFIMKQITGDIPEFEIILPCIFGIFIILSLGLMVFYTKNPTEGGLYAKTKEIEGKGDNQADNKNDNAWF